MNLYGFAGGDPVNHSDPFGLCPPEGEWKEECDKPLESQLTNRRIVATSAAIASIGSASALGGIVSRILDWAMTPKVTTNIGDKISRQMDRRGWSSDDIEATIGSPHATRGATNKANGNQSTAFFNKDGSYVVRDNKTGDVIQISNKNDPNWIPDPTIRNPYRPK